ncbi:hypothetical protein K432DRAFT_43180 [Lepidopterella palustris CBS 459.81]|uniref:Uncharacterized protein n=1 Tax=Lepidopterella palustris CBS 459.81 TaxID=1314670 RepID=A0A8E2EAM1_9PEZI|nr:hypothetical protein K432DRAFT_43180 [Lepidopterella palustris CBS 459.81]
MHMINEMMIMIVILPLMILWTRCQRYLTLSLRAKRWIDFMSPYLIPVVYLIAIFSLLGYFIQYALERPQKPSNPVGAMHIHFKSKHPPLPPPPPPPALTCTYQAS